MPQETFNTMYDQAEALERIAKTLGLPQPKFLRSSANGALYESDDRYEGTEVGTVKINLPKERAVIEIFGLGDMEVVQHDDMGEPLFKVGSKLTGGVEVEAMDRPFGISDLSVLDATLEKMGMGGERSRVIQELIQAPGCLEKEIVVVNPARIQPKELVAYIEQANPWSIIKIGGPGSNVGDKDFDRGNDLLPIQLHLKLAGFTNEEGRAYGESVTDYRDITMLSGPDGRGAKLSRLIGPTQKQFDQMLDSHMDWLDSDGEDGRKGDFSGFNLSGLKIDNKDLRQANFSLANLSETKWSNVRGTQVRFNGATFNDSVFRNASFEDSAFLRTKWTDASLFGVNFSGSNFSEAEISGTSIKGIFRESNLQSVSIQQTSVYESDFTRANFKNARLENTVFIVTDLAEANFEQSEIQKGGFSGGSMIGTSFEDAVVQKTEFRAMDFGDGKEQPAGRFEDCFFLGPEIRNPETDFNLPEAGELTDLPKPVEPVEVGSDLSEGVPTTKPEEVLNPVAEGSPDIQPADQPMDEGVQQNLAMVRNKDLDGWDRAQALSALWKDFEQDEVRKVFFDALEDRDGEVQAEAFRGVYQKISDDPSIVEEIYPLAQSGNEQVQAFAISALSLVAESDEKAFNLIREGLGSEGDLVRLSSVYAMSKFAKEPTVKEALLNRFEDESWIVRWEARKAIFETVDSAVVFGMAVEGGLSDSSETISKWTEMVLLESLEHQNSEIRTVAVRELSQSIQKGEIAEMVSMLGQDKEREVRLAVVEAFRLPAAPPEIATQVLARGVRDSDPEIRELAIAGLSNEDPKTESVSSKVNMKGPGFNPEGGGSPSTPVAGDGGAPPVEAGSGTEQPGNAGKSEVSTSEPIPTEIPSISETARPTPLVATVIQEVVPQKGSVSPVQASLALKEENPTDRLQDFENTLSVLLQSPRHYREALVESAQKLGTKINPGKFTPEQFEEFAPTVKNPETVAKLNGMILTESVYAQAMSNRAARDLGGRRLTETVVFNEMDRYRKEDNLSEIVELVEACGTSFAYRSAQDVEVTRLTSFTRQDAGFVTALMDQGIDASVMMNVTQAMKNSDPDLLMPYLNTLKRVAKENVIIGDPGGSMTRCEIEGLEHFMRENGILPQSQTGTPSPKAEKNEYALSM